MFQWKQEEIWTNGQDQKKQHISDLSNHMNFKKIPYNETNLNVQVCVCVFDTVGEGEFFIIKGDIFKQL